MYRPEIEKYICDLLAIDLPNVEVAKPAEHSLVISSVCMSVENIKLIYTLMKERQKEAGEINDLFVKYLSRIEFLLEHPQGVQGGSSKSVFEPSSERFMVEKCGPDSSRALTPEEFARAQHYILFQDVSVCETSEKDGLMTENWQQTLHRLMLEIDLSSYYNRHIVAHEGKDAGVCKVDILGLLRQIRKYPSGFMVSKEKETRVRLLASALHDHFSQSGEQLARENMERLKETYTKIVARNLDKQRLVEHNLRMALGAISSRMGSIRETSQRAREVVVSGIYAGEFIDRFIFAFEIRRGCPRSAGSPAKNERKVVPTSGYEPGERNGREELKYTIALCNPQPRVVTEKKLAQTMFFGGPKRKAKTAPPALQRKQKIIKYWGCILISRSFINEYSKLREVEELLHSGVDKYK